MENYCKRLNVFTDLPKTIRVFTVSFGVVLVIDSGGSRDSGNIPWHFYDK